MTMAKTIKSVMIRRRVVASVVSRKAEKKLPMKAKPSFSVYGMRAKRGAIIKAADARRTINISYRKINGDVKEYKVEPYSYRSKRLKMGWRKMFFAYDVKDESIKGFLLSNILSVKINTTEPRYKSRWFVELTLGVK